MILKKWCGSTPGLDKVPNPFLRQARFFPAPDFQYSLSRHCPIHQLRHHLSESARNPSEFCNHTPALVMNAKSAYGRRNGSVECRRGPLQEGAHTQSKTQQYVEQPLGLFLFQAPLVPFVLVYLFVWSLFSMKLVFAD
jgi:hypothetical protein